jgi:hypothetical protein
MSGRLAVNWSMMRLMINQFPMAAVVVNAPLKGALTACHPQLPSSTSMQWQCQAGNCRKALEDFRDRSIPSRVLAFRRPPRLGIA